MGPCAVDLPVGFYFHPKDSDLLGYYLYNKVFGKPMKYEVPKINLYGTSEPWKIWKDFGGDDLEIGEDLYFFTTLKTKGTRVSRKAGNGCWHGENSAKVLDPKNEHKVLGFSRRFHYKYPKSDQNGCWIMHEYSLKDYTSMPKSKNSSASDDDGDQLVLCRIRKNDQKLHKNERKRKFNSAAEDHGIDDASVESKSKIQKINIDDHDPIGLTSHEPEFVTNPIGLTQSNHQPEMIDDNQLLGDDFDEALNIAFSYLDGPTIIDNNTTPQMQSYSSMLLCAEREEMGNTTYTDHETSQGIATGSEIIEVTADIGFGTSGETSHEYLDIEDQIAQINMSEPDYLQLDDHVFEMSPFDDHVFEMGPFDDDDPQ
ncbi:hypothetical protein CerSpe_160240 [Prunus speciosa]